MTMHKALQPKHDIDRLYVLRKEGERGLTSTEDCINASIQGLKKYIKKSQERLIATANNSTNKIKIKRTTTKSRKQQWEEKQLMNISSDKLAKSHMKRPGHGYKWKTLREKLNLFL